MTVMCMSAPDCPLSGILFASLSVRLLLPALVHLERISMIQGLVVQFLAEQRHPFPNNPCPAIVLGVWAVPFVGHMSLTRSEEHLQKPAPSKPETQRSWGHPQFHLSSIPPSNPVPQVAANDLYFVSVFPSFYLICFHGFFVPVSANSPPLRNNS